MACSMKVPNALRLGNIIHGIPTSLQKVIKKSLMSYYCFEFSKIQRDGEVECYVRLLQFVTEGHKTYDRQKVKILAPLIDNGINCNKALVHKTKSAQ